MVSLLFFIYHFFSKLSVFFYVTVHKAKMPDFDIDSNNLQNDLEEVTV